MGLIPKRKMLTPYRHLLEENETPGNRTSPLKSHTHARGGTHALAHTLKFPHTDKTVVSLIIRAGHTSFIRPKSESVDKHPTNSGMNRIRTLSCKFAGQRSNHCAIGYPQLPVKWHYLYVTNGQMIGQLSTDIVYTYCIIED